MKYAYLLLSGGVLAAWILLGNTPAIGGAPLPALGKFFYPATGFWHNMLPAKVDRAGSETFTLDDSLASGQIFFDDRNVPHIFGRDLKSVAFLQGFVHAADRMWQMDISTRATEGTLSEVLGARTRVRDAGQRSRGFRQAAVRETEIMAQDFPEDYAVLEAYAAGFNAYRDRLQPEDYPVEYKILGHVPVRWSPYRTALLMKGMSQSLSGRNDDIAEAKTKADFGDALFNELFPERFPDPDPVVPADGRFRRKNPKTAFKRALNPAATTFFVPATPDDIKKHALDAPAGVTDETGKQVYSNYDAELPLPGQLPGLTPHPDNGSNNWAVAGSRSNTGRPLLASDPHLNLTLPSIWSEVQLHYPGVNARGVGLPGAPGIIMGFNDHVAFGETNAGHDVTDWFRIQWTDDNRTHYLLDGEAVAAELIVDTVRVRHGKDSIVRTPWTIFGPVPYTEGKFADHAMRYLGHDAVGKDQRPHTLAGTFLLLTAATSYEDCVFALQGYIDPAQNFVMADRVGNIAIRPNGFFPLRASGAGRFPLEGNSRANNWQGYLPFADRPEHRNPVRGFVASANQRTAADNFAYDYHGGFGEYRGRHINDQLRRQEKMTQRNMKELQLSSYSLLAEELTPLLISRLNRRDLTKDGTRLLRLLSEWDYRCEAESRAATLFDLWQRRLYRLTFDEFPRDSGYISPELWRWNELLAENPRHRIFDIDSTENFRETAVTLTQRAFDEILDELDGQLPKTWSESRNTRIGHLGSIPGFGTELIVSPGSRYSPRALSSRHGASWRMVVELGERPRAWGALPGGASGNPASPAYDNGMEDWASGHYHELIRWMDVGEAEQRARGSWRFE